MSLLSPMGWRCPKIRNYTRGETPLSFFNGSLRIPRRPPSQPLCGPGLRTPSPQPRGPRPPTTQPGRQFPRIHMVMKASIFSQTHTGPSDPPRPPTQWPPRAEAPPPVGFSQGREREGGGEEPLPPNPQPTGPFYLGVRQ